MSKAQMHNGYKSAVFSKDESNCNPLEGFLKKKNSHGVWQKRWFYLNNEFMIYKKDQKAGAKDIKGAIDISQVDTVQVSAKGDLDVLMKGGEAKLQLKAADQAEAENWEQHIYQRLDWLHHESELQDLADKYEEEMQAGGGGQVDGSGTGTNRDRAGSGGGGIAPPVQFSGWLKKKSPKKYAGMQDRFVKIEHNYMHYFKTEADSKNVSASLGGVSLETVDWVRPYDNTPECSTLEVQAGGGGRVFLFVAESPASMRQWVALLTQGRENALAILEKKAAAKLAAATPYRIRIYDDKSPAALVALVREDIEDLFPLAPPADCSEEEEVEFNTLEKKLRRAKDVVEYLEDMLPEVQKVPTGSLKRPARLDVLAAAMVEINSFLAERLTTLLDPACMDTSNINLGDLHAMIGWLTDFKLALSDIYCPPTTPGGASPAAFHLFQVLPQLCQWYVEGVPGTTCEGAAKHIKGHVLKIFENFVSNPSELLQRHHADGTFYTHAPTDIWELLHHHLSLATSTASPVLSFMVANAIVEELNVVIRKTTAYVTQMHQPDPSGEPPAVYREVELELLCALSNDIALHFEQVQTVIEKFNIEEIRNKVDSLFDALSDKLIMCGQACLRRLSTLVMEDMSENMQEIFTPAWLGDPPPEEPPSEPSGQISVALATISDYLADLNEFLVPFWSSRLVDFLLEVLVTKYFKLVMKIRDSAPPPPPPEDSPKSSPGPSKAPSRRGLLSHMSSKMLNSARDLTKVVAEKVADTVSKGLRASEASVVLIENDTAAIEDFFCDKTSNAGEYIKLLADLAELLIAEPDDLSRLLMSRINQAILESATRCAALRDDLSKDELDMIFLPLEPMLQIHSEAGAGAGSSDVIAVAPEHRLLCGLYCDLGLTQKKSLTEMLLGSKGGGGASSTTRKILESSSSATYERQQSIEEDKEEDEGDHLDHVLDALENVEEEYLTMVAAEEEAEQRKEEEEQKALEAGRAAINFEGMLGKKSPAHNLWQDRWFKLMTRVEADEEGEFHNHHTLLWYKKKGGTVIKSINAKTISGMQLISSPRPLAYREDNFRVYLTHDPEGEGGVDVREWRSEDEKETSYVFSVHLESGSGGSKDKGKDKDMILKAKTVDLLLQWMNHFAVAAKLEYLPATGVWAPGSRVRKASSKRRVSKRTSASAGTVGGATMIVNDMSQKRNVVVPESVAEENTDTMEIETGMEIETERDQLGQRVLHMEGDMEKKSPAHNLWQSRHFKLMTKQRESVSGESFNVYTLLWYKKKGGSVLKTLSADVFSGLILLSCPLNQGSPTVEYSTRDHNLHPAGLHTHTRVVKPKDGGSSDGTFSFLLQCKGGVGSGGGGGDKDIILRVDSAAKLMSWVNCLAEAAGLGYSDVNAMWLPGGRAPLEGREQEDSFYAEGQQQQDEEDGEKLGMEEGQDEGGEERESVGAHQRMIFVEGELEKKSPAHNLWQMRYFKLTTRQAEGGSTYTLMWFKKKDSSVLKSVSAASISGLTLLACARPVVYSQRDHCLHQSDLNDPLLVGALPVRETSPEPSTYSFVVQCRAGAGGGGGGDKDITLRTDSVDRLVLWINSLAEAAGLEYREQGEGGGCGGWHAGPRTSVVVANPKAMMRIAAEKSVQDRPEEEVPEVLNEKEVVMEQHQLEEEQQQEEEDVESDRDSESDNGHGHGTRDGHESSDSEVDAGELERQGIGSSITAMDFDRREEQPQQKEEKVREGGGDINTDTYSMRSAPPTVPLKMVTATCNEDDEDESGAVSSPLHAANMDTDSDNKGDSDGDGDGGVVVPASFDMSAFESRGGNDDGDGGGGYGSDEDIKEYRMSDDAGDLQLKPAGCSGCVVM